MMLSRLTMHIEKSIHENSSVITNLRHDVEKGIYRILKKSRTKVDPKILQKIVDFFFLNYNSILESVNQDIDDGQINMLESKSKNDLKLAKIAYEIEDYGNALFHLQQSVEKIVKAHGLKLGVIKDPKKEIGHNTPKVYIKMLKLPWMEEMSTIVTPNQNTMANIEILESKLKKSENSAILDKDIPFFLELYETSLKQTRKGFSRREVKIMVSEVKKISEIDIEWQYMTQIKYTFVLYLFSFVTWIYAIEPRYEGEYDKLNIILYFEKIIELLDEAYA